MSYIIMGIDECGSEFRADQKEYQSRDLAWDRMDKARENYPEAHSIWVETYRDQSYYYHEAASNYGH